MKRKRWNQMPINFLFATLGLLSFNVANTWAQQPQGDYGSHMMWNGGWFGMVFGSIMMIVFIGTTVAIVILLVRWLGGPTAGVGSASSSSRDPIDILKERFARGEIDKEEFEERRKVLRD
jgi:putative membrane protein